MGNCSNASNDKRREREKERSQQNLAKENLINIGINNQTQIINIESNQSQINQIDNRYQKFFTKEKMIDRCVELYQQLLRRA